MNKTAILSLPLNKRLYTLCLAMFVVLPHFAEIISPSNALDIARQYVQVKAKDKQMIKRLSKKAHRKTFSSQATPYYLFNDAQNRGFVLVAGDNALGEVLAYSNTNTLDTTSINPGARYLLEEYKKSFIALQKRSRQQTRLIKITSLKTKVPELLTSKWNQDSPYNLQLGPNQDGSYPYTGCVATAVAQIMAFHKWPIQGSGSNAYRVTHYNDRLTADFSKSRYDWNNMRDEYRSSANEQQKNAVALLMKDVGIATNMQYTPWYSGTLTWNAKEAVSQYFQYDAALLSKATEGSNFVQVIHQEISNGYPVYLSGFQSLGKSGHAWVADGYDEKGLTHMNFGWGGQADGYYSIDAINVENSGAEFGGKSLSFSKGMEALLMHPHKDGKNTLPTEFQNEAARLMGNNGFEFRLAEGQAKIQDQHSPIRVTLSDIINKGNAFNGKIGLVVYNEQQQQMSEPNYASSSIDLLESGLYTGKIPISLNVKDLKDGRYIIAPICQPSTLSTTNVFYPIRNTPKIVLEIKDGKAHVLQEYYTGAGYIWDGKPASRQPLRVGSSAELYCPIRILQAAYKQSTFKVSFINAQGTEVYIAQSRTDGIEMQDFQTKQISLNVDLPQSLSPGTYRLKAQMIWSKDALSGLDKDKYFDVQETNETSTTTIEVKPQLQSSQLMVLGSTFEDNSGTSFEAQQPIPVNGNFKFSLSIKNNSNTLFRGNLKCYFEEQATGVRVPLEHPFLNNITIEKKLLSLPTSGWLKNESLKVNNDKAYHLIVVQQLENGDQIEVPFAPGKQRTYWFKNATVSANSTSTYVPQPQEFFTLKLATTSAYVVAPSSREVEKSELSTIQEAEAKNDARAIFYREGDYIISLSTGRVIQWNSEERDWNQVLTFAPEGQMGSPLHWIQQDGNIRPRGLGYRDIALSTPIIAERVDVLPITLAPHGMASFFTPVQGKVTDGTAYRATLDNEGQLELHKIEGDIPANTAFLVENIQATQVHFQIKKSSGLLSPFSSNDNILYGSVTTPPTTSSSIVYALSGEEKAYHRLGAWQRPFRAYIIRATALGHAPSFSIKPTGIVSPQLSTKNTWNTPIFDLTGRRISTPKSGQILIEGGRKVMH
jgi:putative thiol protease/hemagglutinin prtT